MGYPTVSAVLVEAMEYLRVSRERLSFLTKIPLHRVNEIIDENKKPTHEEAEELELMFKISKYRWLELSSN